MKKSLIALAVLASAGVASAQSSVTLFGVVDLTLSNLRADGAGKINTLRDAGYNSSRIGFRGTEDLGGGMAASFWLEGGFTADNGAGQNTTMNNTAAGDRFLIGSGSASAVYAPQATAYARQGLTFNRRSTVSLSGGFGEVRLGRDYIPSFWNLSVFDPFGSLGVGSALNVSLGPLNPFANSAFAPGAAAPQIRSSNSIGYFLPANLGGFYGQVMYALGDHASNCNQPLANSTGSVTNLCTGAKDDGRYMGGRVGYANGPLNVALGYGTAKFGDVPAATPLGTIAGYNQTAAYRGNYKQLNLGGQWDFGVAKLMGLIGEQRHDATAVNPGQKLRHATIGALVPVGPGEIRVSYNYARRSDGLGAGSADGSKINQLALGYVHNLSKRTAVYASVATQRIRAGVAGSGGPSVGLNGAALGSNASGKASGYDFGLRHSF